MGMRNTFKIVAVSALVLGAAAVAAEKADIEDIMKKSMKGKTSLIKKAIAGTATDDEKKQLLGYVKQLEGTKPPAGEQADWDKRIKALIAATEDVVANKDGAPAKLDTVSKCKDCHDVHKKD